jgi:hypothetical protein
MSGQMKMNKLQKSSPRMPWLGTIVLLMLAAFAGTAPPTLAQDIVQGKFSLSAEARLGKTVLPAGDYKFSVVPLGNLRSISSIQTGNSLVQVVVWSLTRGGPLANLFATASTETNASNPEPLGIREDENGPTIHAMSLERLGVVLRFVDHKNSSVMRARAPEPRQTVASVKGGT